MNTTLKIIEFEFKDVFRSRWVILYGIFLLFSVEALYEFSGDSSKVIISVLSIILLINPLLSLVFGSLYIYYSREFIELLLSQPIRRSQLFFGLYFGMAVPLSLVFLVGAGLPLLINVSESIPVILIMLSSGILLIFMFTAVAFCISTSIVDKAKGLGAAFLIWFFFAFLFDGLLLLGISAFQDYPLEAPLIILSFLNPIDLARLLVMLKLDAAALMGYTGAVFERFFGDVMGMVMSFAMLLVWLLAPLTLAGWLFRKNDF
ncbi:MAG: hypothetical protein HW421_928 [Ignavibacteria bacterium]|nr:hypothetical protein [Ignavibacteria bacterium]